MEKRMEVFGAIKGAGLLPLFYHEDPAVCTGLTEAVYRAGLRVVEFTNRGDQALKNFELLRKQVDNHLPGLWLGAGTIKTASDAQHFISAGADFLVSPGLSDDVFDVAYSEKIPWIPGCMSVSEMMKAESLGLDFVKLFPGNVLGPAFVQAVREIFPSMDFVVTGGVDPTVSGLAAWFRAGVSAVGIGGKIFDKSWLAARDFAAVEAKVRETAGLIQQLIPHS